MGEAIAADAETSVGSLFASLPRWARIATVAIFVAECLMLAAGLTRGGSVEKGTIRIDLSSARPAPGFSTL